MREPLANALATAPSWGLLLIVLTAMSPWQSLPQTMINPIKIIDQSFWHVSGKLFERTPRSTSPQDQQAPT
jgi:hypothetical protein